jgi:hypothetical protein
MRERAIRRTGVLLTWLIAGCGGGASHTGASDLSASPDLAAPVDLAAAADLATAPDLSPALDLVVGPDLSPLSCAGIFNCAMNCPPADLANCIPACIAQGSLEARAHFLPLQNCAGPACYSMPDAGGPPPCAKPASAECAACVLMDCNKELADCRSH